jgi:hypothetical protein
VLSRDEAMAWAEIEDRLVEAHARRAAPVLARMLVPLLLAGAAAVLGLTGTALFFLLFVPVGPVLYMLDNPPPRRRD